MKEIIIALIGLSLLCSCGQLTGKDHQLANDSAMNQFKRQMAQINIDQDTNKKVGEKLFMSILDTIKKESISIDFLVSNQWVYKPFTNCESYLKFQTNGKGTSYNCEMEEEYEMTYKIEANKVFIAEHDIPQVDNEDRKKIKFRDDTYIFNGHALIMVDSRIYNIDGRMWIPKIEVIINYYKKKY